ERDVPPGRIDVSLTGPSGATWNWQTGDRVALEGAQSEGVAGEGVAGEGVAGAGGEEQGEGGRSQSSVRGSALDFCLVVTQRRHVADTSLVIAGPEAAEWMSIAQAFAGPPGPGRPPRRRNE
ncbi:MAG: hypothetical protein ACRDYE_16470, partial [Acidimicrobiales bacterium]